MLTEYNSGASYAPNGTIWVMSDPGNSASSSA